MNKRFFHKRTCPVCAQDVFIHTKSGMIADHSRSKYGQVMPKCPMIGRNFKLSDDQFGIWHRFCREFVDPWSIACEEYRNSQVTKILDELKSEGILTYESPPDDHV